MRNLVILRVHGAVSKHMLPCTTIFSDGPTKVMVNLYVRSFEKIDDVKMEFSVQITFRKELS